MGPGGGPPPHGGQHHNGQMPGNGNGQPQKPMNQTERLKEALYDQQCKFLGSSNFWI
jgi:hypothetical protein